MIINPLCDMPEEIYKDFLADQGFDELRDVPFCSLIGGIYSVLHSTVHGLYVWGSNEFARCHETIDPFWEDITHSYSGLSFGWNLSLSYCNEYYCNISDSGAGNL